MRTTSPGLAVNGPALRAIRERSGLTRADVGRAAGVAASTVSRAEVGLIRLTPPTLRAIARALAVPVTAILASPDDGEAA